MIGGMSRYDPSWESVDDHRVPEWYHDAKFGVFVHYSPSWFGDDLPVPTEYDAGEWVSAIEGSGARYVVFTTKHHDGFSNWPSAHTDFGAERTDGPRDIVTPLVETATQRGLKVGFYYSWLDNHHPDYPATKYVEEFAHAQIKELWDRYRPSILWGDGEWDHSADHWRAREIVSWYYNQAANEERDVLVNDRLGVDTRYYYVHGLDGTDRDVAGPAHGDYWTPEHQVASDVIEDKWEVCETMHEGWAWTESAAWRDVGDLVRLLVDVVSKNGNLLLNVGPRPDGTFSQEEIDRLQALGRWLEINGEAIYGTRPYEPASTEIAYVPDIDWDNPGDTWEDLRSLIAPNGQLRFTRRGQVAYAITLGWPEDGVIRLEDVRLRAHATVSMLGVNEPLQWEDRNGSVHIELPAQEAPPCEHAYAIRLPLAY